MEEKKVVLVTGGASGIGFGTIEYLLEQGKYNVISFSRGENNIAIAKEKLKENKYNIFLFKKRALKFSPPINNYPIKFGVSNTIIYVFPPSQTISVESPSFHFSPLIVLILYSL